jgi:hypothetical protein
VATLFELIPEDWCWLLGAAFILSLWSGAWARCPLSPDEEARYLFQWGLLALYVEFFQPLLPLQCGRLLLLILVPYEALAFWAHAIYCNVADSTPKIGPIGIETGQRPKNEPTPFPTSEFGRSTAHQFPIEPAGHRVEMSSPAPRME